MIRPVLDRGTTTVPGRLAWIRDVRVPEMFPGEFEPRPLGELAFNLACPDGRHTFDVIEAVAQERWSENPADPSGRGVNRQRFRMTLTCITCGRVERRQGEYQDTGGTRTTRVDPVPRRFKHLSAQMIDPGTRWSRAGRDASAWAVHEAATGAVVGVICPEIGRRGAIRHAGRLSVWPRERDWVRGASPVAVLRALARAQAADDAGETGTTEVGDTTPEAGTAEVGTAEIPDTAAGAGTESGPGTNDNGHDQGTDRERGEWR